jgi:hypothetical protein
MMTGTILANDVKKDTEIVLTDGTPAVVWDNKRGVIRMIKVPSLFGGAYDMGSEYIRRWSHVKATGVRIVPSPAQRKQLDKIRASGF